MSVEPFPRCAVRRPDGARCWLAPGHPEVLHLVVPPGDIPTAATIARVCAARPDLDDRTLGMMVGLEPVGRENDLMAYLAAGGDLHRGGMVEIMERFLLFVRQRRAKVVN